MIEMSHRRSGAGKAGYIPSMASGLARSLGRGSCRMRPWCPDLEWCYSMEVMHTMIQKQDVNTEREGLSL